MNYIEQLYNYALDGAGAVAAKIIWAIIILLVGWWIINVLTKAIRRLMKRTKMDEGIVSFLSSITKASFRIILFVCMAAELGINVTSIIAALGASLVTVGLALKDSLSNIASGILIIINQPFKTGDHLKVGDLEGDVVKMEMMYTTLATYDERSILIPNSKLINSNIINHSTQKDVRIDIKYIIDRDVDLQLAKNILANLIAKDEKICKDRENRMFIEGYKTYGTTIVLRFWCKLGDEDKVREKIQEEIKLEFDKNEIKGYSL